jgi:hypothetical protein
MYWGSDYSSNVFWTLPDIYHMCIKQTNKCLPVVGNIFSWQATWSSDERNDGGLQAVFLPSLGIEVTHNQFYIILGAFIVFFL